MRTHKRTPRYVLCVIYVDSSVRERYVKLSASEQRMYRCKILYLPLVLMSTLLLITLYCLSGAGYDAPLSTAFARTCGYMASIFSMIQYVPQIYKTWKLKVRSVPPPSHAPCALSWAA